MTTAAKQQTLGIIPSRMGLSSVVRGKIDTPIRVLVFGPEGIGKSTFGAAAPKAIFLPSEEGTQQLDVARFPRPESVADVRSALHTLVTEKHEFGTLVVDTLDWIEPLVWSKVIDDANRQDSKRVATGIEEVGGGYGKGYTAAVDVWREILKDLERVWRAGMHVVLLAHSQIKKYANPTGDDFDRYELKLNQKAAGLFKEWTDATLFANYETYAKRDEKNKNRVRGVSTGARLLFGERTAAFDAKNRYGLPPELPLSWADFFDAAKGGKGVDVGALKLEIERKAKELGGDLEKTIIETMKKAGEDRHYLATVNNRVNARLAERVSAAETKES